MTPLYIVCKHRISRYYRDAIHNEYVIDDIFHSRDIAKAYTAILNSRAQKYFYKIKKVTV